MENVRKRLRSDRGDSELVSLLIVLPLVLGILFTIIDVSIYFSDRALIQSSVRDAARTVAIMGGNGTADSATPIEKKYGQTRATACADLSSNARVSEAFKATTTPIECNALQTYAKDAGLINVKITSLECTPTVTKSIGAKTTCVVEWEYGSIPGSVLGFLRITKENVVTGTSESEVDFTGGSRNVPDSSILEPR